MTTTDPEPRADAAPRRRTPRVRALLVPSGVSLAVHAVLLVLLLTVTVAALNPGRAPGGDPDAGVSVTLAAPAPTEDLDRSPAPQTSNRARDASEPATPERAEQDAAAALHQARALADALERDAPAPAEPSPGAGVVRPDAPAAGRATRLTPPAPPPAAQFAGVRGGEQGRVLYMLDTSGPMASSLRFVTAEAARSIERLDAGQRFAVLAFAARADGSPELRVFPPGEAVGDLPATPTNKAAARAWLDTLEPGGGNALAPALRLALARGEAQTVFLLARSIERTNEPDATAEARQALLREIDRLNRPRGTRAIRPATIVTVQFIDPDPVALLPAIGAAHSGRAAPAPGEISPGHTVLSIDELLARWERGETEARARALVDQGEARLAGVGIESVGVLLAPRHAAARDRAAVREAGEDAQRALDRARALGLPSDASERHSALTARARALVRAAGGEPGALPLAEVGPVLSRATGAVGAFERAAYELARSARLTTADDARDALERFDAAADAPELRGSDARPAPSVARAAWSVCREHVAPHANSDPRHWATLERWARAHADATGQSLPAVLAPLVGPEVGPEVGPGGGPGATPHTSTAAALARVLALDAREEPHRADEALIEAIAAHPGDDDVRRAVEQRLRALDPRAHEPRVARLLRASLAQGQPIPHAEAIGVRHAAWLIEHAPLAQAARFIHDAFPPESEAHATSHAALRGAARARLLELRRLRAERDAPWPAPEREAIASLARAWRETRALAIPDDDGLDLIAWAHTAGEVDALRASEGAPPDRVLRAHEALEAIESAGDAGVRFRLAPERVRLLAIAEGPEAARAAARDAIASNPFPETDPTAIELWTLLLRSLHDGERSASAGERAAARAHIARLRAIDPGLGGEPWGPRLIHEAGR